MLDLALLRKQPEVLAQRLTKRSYTLDLDRFNDLEANRRSLQVETEHLQSQRNALSKADWATQSQGRGCFGSDGAGCVHR